MHSLSWKIKICKVHANVYIKKNLSLQNSCKKLLNKKEENGSRKMRTVEGTAFEEQKIIKKLREQQSCKQQAVKSQKTLHKCLNRILRKSSQHQRLLEVHDEVS